MEDAIAKDEGAEGIGLDHAAVMGVGDIDTTEEFALGVGTVVSIGVLHEPEARLLGDDDAIVMEGDAIECIKAFDEGGELVGFSVLVGVFEDDDFIWRGEAGNGVGEGGHGDDPEAATGIKGDLDGVAEFWELFFGSEEADFVAFGDFEFGLVFGDGLMTPKPFLALLPLPSAMGGREGSGMLAKVFLGSRASW